MVRATFYFLAFRGRGGFIDCPGSCPPTDGSKVRDGASELQLDCVVEERGGVKRDGLLSLADLSQPDDFPTAPHNGPLLTEMSSPMPVEPSNIKLDPGTGDGAAGVGEERAF